MLNSLISKRALELIYKIEDLLQGEPARFIFYGAALVVWAVVGIANALGYTQFGLNLGLTNALTDATAAGAVITETIRHFVYSPNSVQASDAAAFHDGYVTATQGSAALQTQAAAPVVPPNA